MRSQCTKTKSSPSSPQLEKAHAQQQRPKAVKKSDAYGLSPGETAEMVVSPTQDCSKPYWAPSAHSPLYPLPLWGKRSLPHCTCVKKVQHWGPALWLYLEKRFIVSHVKKSLQMNFFGALSFLGLPTWVRRRVLEKTFVCHSVEVTGWLSFFLNPCEI